MVKPAVPAIRHNLRALRVLVQITPFIIDADARCTMLALIDDSTEQLDRAVQNSEVR